ncbi:MAG: hypothetical protein GWN30_20615 [Gammaproteobacteria bacterium]|nr:hypothetical protein [Gammaproteobacteria bacterium]NIX00621.1 hypothetical protein [Phycisphaerae bacterium]
MAGRPPKKDRRMVKIPVGYKLPRWLVEWMREQPESQAAIIEDAVMEKHNLKEPS